MVFVGGIPVHQGPGYIPVLPQVLESKRCALDCQYSSTLLAKQLRIGGGLAEHLFSYSMQSGHPKIMKIPIWRPGNP